MKNCCFHWIILELENISVNSSIMRFISVKLEPMVVYQGNALFRGRETSKVFAAAWIQAQAKSRPECLMQLEDENKSFESVNAS